MPPPKSHWANFLASFRDDAAVLTCAVCIDMRAQAQLSLEGENPEDAGAASLPPKQKCPPNNADHADNALDAGDAVDDSSEEQAGRRKAGRPRKTVDRESLWSLAAWVQRRRNDVYVQTDRSHDKSATYFCRPCNREIKFQTHTCKKKILRHEAYQCHQKGLARMRGLQSQEPANAGAAQSGESCEGMVASKLPLGESVLAFVQAGQPRLKYAAEETDPFDGIVSEVLPSDIAVRSSSCERRVAGGMVKAKNFRSALSRQAYMIDLCRLSFHIWDSSPEDLEKCKQELRQRDYQQQNLAGNDLDRFLGIGNKLDLCRAVAAKMEFIPAWRVSASLKSFWDVWLKKPHRAHGTSAEAEAYSSRVRGMTESLTTGRARHFDLMLASRVAAGALRADVLVESLCTSFLAKFESGLQESRRRTTSAFANYDVLSESLATLGKHQEVVSLFQTFRVNPKKLKSISIVNDRYPHPHVAISDPAQLRENYSRALGHLRFGGSRPHLVVDETTWSATWSQVRSFRKDSEGELQDAWIGGCWSSKPEEDFSVLPTNVHKEESLPKDRLAKLALHVCVLRTDSIRFVYDLCVLPRPPGVGSSMETLEVVARVLHEVTVAGGLPPNGLAFDGGSNNAQLLHCFLGQLDGGVQTSLPFFSECVIDNSFQDLAFWPHRFLRHGERGEHILVAFNGAWHWAKRFIESGPSGRLPQEACLPLLASVCLGVGMLDRSLNAHAATALIPGYGMGARTLTCLWSLPTVCLTLLIWCLMPSLISLPAKQCRLLLQDVSGLRLVCSCMSFWQLLCALPRLGALVSVARTHV